MVFVVEAIGIAGAGAILGHIAASCIVSVGGVGGDVIVVVRRRVQQSERAR